MSVRECAAATRSFQHLQNFKSAAQRDLLSKFPVTVVALQSFDFEVKLLPKLSRLLGMNTQNYSQL